MRRLNVAFGQDAAALTRLMAAGRRVKQPKDHADDGAASTRLL